MHDETREFLRKLEAGEDSNDNTSIVPHGQRPCPICGKRMHVDDEAGIQTDVCPDHGVWLDTGELAAITARVRSYVRSREKRYRRAEVRNAKKDGIWSGATLGIWAFLFDD